MKRPSTSRSNSHHDAKALPTAESRSRRRASTTMELEQSDATTTLVRAIKENFKMDDMNGIQRYGFRIKIQTDKQITKTFSYTPEMFVALPSINWCRKTCQLLPVYTAGDGNCLLHALSLYIWGIHDRYILRRKMHEVLNSNTPEKRQLYDQWHYFFVNPHLNIQGDRHDEPPIYMGAEVLNSEWLDISNIWARNHSDRRITAPLGNFNIYVMANLLRRPIIVHGKEYVVNRAKAKQEGVPDSYDLMCGIYLPLNVEPSLCVRSPVLIGYDLVARHYMPLMRVCPLIDMANEKMQGSPEGCTSWKAAAIDGGCSNVVPLTAPDKSLLKLKYKSDRNVGDVELLYRYMNIHWLKLDGDDQAILCAALNDAVLPHQWSNMEPESHYHFSALGKKSANEIAKVDLANAPMPVPEERPSERHVKRPIYVCQTRGCYEALTSTDVVFCIECQAASSHY